MKEMELEGDGSNEDDEDSEYDYFAGNDDRYDSRLDDFDELAMLLLLQCSSFATSQRKK